jgi:hypothetical protein
MDGTRHQEDPPRSAGRQDSRGTPRVPTCGDDIMTADRDAPRAPLNVRA